MHDRRAVKMLGYFALFFLFFGLISYLCFMMLSVGRTLRSYRTEMGRTAAFLADMIASHTDEENREKESLSSYLQELETLTHLKLWVVDASYVVHAGADGGGFEELAGLAGNMGDIIAGAFGGSTAYGINPGGILPDQSVTVGVPIRSSENDVVGVLVVYAPGPEVSAIAQRGLGTLALSLLVACGASIIAACVVIPGWLRPLEATENFAEQIAGGNYTRPCELTQNGGMGELDDALRRIAHQFEVAEAGRLKAERLRQSFLTNTSNELRAPVAQLCSYLGAMESNMPAHADKVAEYHSLMQAESLYLARLIDDLTDLTFLQSEGASLVMEPLDLCDIAADVIARLQPMAQAKGLEIVRSDAGDRMPFVGDPRRLRQMLTIIVENAIQFGPEGTTVVVGPIIRSAAYTWSVVDWGPGIPPERLPHIFEPFNRTRSAPRGAGSGLGLAIAWQIAEHHGIKIEVDSRPGKTEFIFIFPVGPEEPPPFAGGPFD